MFRGPVLFTAELMFKYAVGWSRLKTPDKTNVLVISGSNEVLYTS